MTSPRDLRVVVKVVGYKTLTTDIRSVTRFSKFTYVNELGEVVGTSIFTCNEGRTSSDRRVRHSPSALTWGPPRDVIDDRDVTRTQRVVTHLETAYKRRQILWIFTKEFIF